MLFIVNILQEDSTFISAGAFAALTAESGLRFPYFWTAFQKLPFAAPTTATGLRFQNFWSTFLFPPFAALPLGSGATHHLKS